jgi:hypothetical protein
LIVVICQILICSMQNAIKSFTIIGGKFQGRAAFTP